MNERKLLVEVTPPLVEVSLPLIIPIYILEKT